MPGFRTNVSLEQQMPSSSDSRDADLNYTLQFNWLHYGSHIRKSMIVVNRPLDSMSAEMQKYQLYTLCSNFSLS